jgi:uncharacterized protein YabN with tetrapyrrole methylase and pyrophosphatase domain
MTAFQRAQDAAAAALETSFFKGRDTRDAALSKLVEEAQEIRTARTPGELEGEIGDALFVLVRLAVQESVDPEAALLEAAGRFDARLGISRALCRAEGEDDTAASLEQWERWWKVAKAVQGSPAAVALALAEVEEAKAAAQLQAAKERTNALYRKLNNGPRSLPMMGEE